MRRIAVVGACAAGLAAVQELRDSGYDGEITVVGAEPHLPYDRPPLSKHVLRGEWAPERTTLLSPDRFDELGAQWWLGRPAIGLDLERRHVLVDGGDEFPFDAVVVATGLRPRQLPGTHDVNGTYVLRSWEDSVRLGAELRPGREVVVVGAGLIGMEVAAVAREIGCAVTVVDNTDVPLQRVFGATIGRHVLGLHRRRGVRFRLGVGVAGLRGAEDVDAVTLADGSTLPAQVVLVAIGSVPNTEWLAGSGLSVADGIVCDATGRAGPAVVAAGDVAAWFDARTGRHRRVEHRLNATWQGRGAARALLGAPPLAADVPYFWTDQYDTKVQVYGDPGGEADFVTDVGDPEQQRFAGTFSSQGQVRAGLSWNLPREALRLRQLILAANAAS